MREGSDFAVFLVGLWMVRCEADLCMCVPRVAVVFYVRHEVTKNGSEVEPFFILF